MNESEQKIASDQERKEKIRQRYKGVDEDQLSVIPAIPKLDIFDRDKKLRVAIYARVSTDDPNQTSSYELQKNHYTDLVNRNPNWELIGIYADEGISGTSMNHRVNFIRMIEDCEKGLIDLVVTKSVSRFARNLLDSVGCVRRLAAQTPPVGVYFEAENINTFKNDNEMILAIVSSVAQEESHIKSEAMNYSIEMRFKRGIFLTPALLGYDKDENGDLVINEEEAKTVRLIFFMYIYGYTCSQIAETLTKLQRTTKKGNTTWSDSTVYAQLTNERHCGSILARKTFTPSYIDHKSRKNRNDRNQYVQAVHHEPIISPKDFIYVQHMLRYSTNGNVNILPVLHVIPDGLLTGFVTVNPRWSGFTPLDYLTACESIQPGASVEDSDPPVTVEKGEFDLRGYEIVRSEFFDIANRFSMTISSDRLKFSSSCTRKIDSAYVEILIHPVKRIIAIRKTTTDNRLAFNWSRVKNGINMPRHIGISAISACLFTLSGWDVENKYRIYGTQIENGDSPVILFNISDAETILSRDTEDKAEDNTDSEKKASCSSAGNMIAYPASWADGFGVDYYSHRYLYESAIPKCNDPVIIAADPVPYNPDPKLEVLDPVMIASRIDDVLNEITPAEEA